MLAIFNVAPTDGIDTRPPQTKITSGPTKGQVVRTRGVTLSYASSEPGSAFACSLNGVRRACPPSGTPTGRGLRPGSDVFRIAATDLAGITDPTPRDPSVPHPVRRPRTRTDSRDLVEHALWVGWLLPPPSGAMVVVCLPWRRRPAVLAAALILVLASACSEDPPQTDADASPTPSVAPVTPSETTPGSPDEVMQAVRDEMAEYEELLPGMVAVVQIGDERYVETMGVADRRAQRPMRAADRFQIASVTKTIVATAVMQLVAEGDLALDDSVESLLPGLLPQGDQITVENLLSHRTGLPNYSENGIDGTRQWQPEELVRIVTDEPLLRPPGTVSSYSNTNYIVLGLIIEKVTGTTARERARCPDLRPRRHEGHLDGRCAGDRATPARGYEGSEDVTHSNLSPVWAAGGVVGTAGDVMTFLQALFDNELLPSDGVADMTHSRGLTVEGTGVEYGLGIFRLALSCGEAWGHNGESDGYHAEAWILPDGDRSAVVLENEAGYAAGVGVVEAALCT